MTNTDLNTRIQQLITHAYAHAPAIQRMMDAAGLQPSDIQTADDLAKLPVTSKDSLVALHKADPPFGGLLAMNPDDLPRIYISPGPIFDPNPPNAATGNVSASMGALQYLNIGRGDRVLNTFAYHLTPAGMMLDESVIQVGGTVIPAGPGNSDLQILMMQTLNISTFAGQPSYLMALLDKCEQMGLTKDQISIKKAAFSAEPYLPAQQQRFEGEYGMKTTSIYGTADLGSVGFTMQGLQGFVISPTLYLQVCDPQTGQPLPYGEIGEVVVTSFNQHYALIRFGTGDLGALAADPDPLTQGRQQLLGLYGRSGDAVKVRGMFLHPSQLRAGLGLFPQIKQAQVVITRPQNNDFVTLLLELNPGADSTGLGDNIKALAQGAVRLRIDDVTIVEPGVIDPTQRMVRDDRVWE
ncbi:MAG: AMP-binding protein [Armatimonadetes bacterium]|nr:AMP-binding protein [Anaerolineae bacterium]